VGNDRTGGARARTAPVTRDAGAVEDPRVEALRAAVARLQRELAGHPAELSDRSVAEESLAELEAMAASGVPESARLRRTLLLVVGAVGSVSALAPALAEVREVIDLFGADIPGPRQGE
jgi:Family of unknown function (DUF5955)